MERIIVKGKEKEDSVLFKLREDGKITFKEIPFNNYFYINYEDFEVVEFLIKNYVEEIEEVTDKFNRKFIKLILKNNTHRYFLLKKLQDAEVKHYEADIDAVKRFLITNQNIDLNQDKAEHVFFDIETDDRNPLEKDFNGNVVPNSPILSCAFKDKHGRVQYFVNPTKNRIVEYPEVLEYKELMNKFITDRKNKEIKNRLKELEPKIDKLMRDGERELIELIIRYLSNYDVTLSYNGWRFDIPYIKTRGKEYGLDFDDTWTIDMDYMEIYKKNQWGSLKSYSLQNVCIHEFENEIENPESKFNNLDEVTKIDWKEKTNCKKFWELYWCEDEILKEYNIQDVHLMFLLEEKLNYMALQSIIGKICHCPLIDTVHNSKSFDYAMLNEYKNNNIIAPSKPSKEEIESRKNITIGGGYTYVELPGFHEKVSARDYKSFYPTIDVTFNISPETFVKNVEPDLLQVFAEPEVEFIEYCRDISKRFLNAQGNLNKKKYEQACEKKRQEINCPTMKELMFRFVENYRNEELIKYCKENNLVFTPADINYDTRGWDIHPHRLYKRDEGIFPKLSRTFLQNRDAVKYEKKNVEFESAEWWEKHHFEQGLKTLGNSGYGAFAFKSFRFFMREIGDSITTGCRFIMKKSILFARKHGFTITHGDTDSAYMKNTEQKYTMDELDYLFYNYYDEFIEDYNTNCEIELTNPKTGEIEKHKHFIVFEFEKELESVIVIKKKRYYFKEWKEEAQKFKYGTQGGAYKKTDTMPLAAEMQKELTKNILDKKYDRELWYTKIKSLKEKVDDFALDEEHVVMTKGVNNRPSEYGGPVIDGKTGKPKIKADGTIQQRPIPCHIKIAAEMIEKGYEIEVGDKIDYVIIESKPRQVGISLDEFRENPRYDETYYWERIESPLLEILRVVDPEGVYEKYWDCWSFAYKKSTKKQLEEDPDFKPVFNEVKRKRLKEELRTIGEEDDDEEEESEE